MREIGRASCRERAQISVVAVSLKKKTKRPRAGPSDPQPEPTPSPPPPGTVTFTIYSGTSCTGDGSSAGTGALSGGIAHRGSDAAVAAGGLAYRAHYNGNATYNEADGPCETLTATTLAATVATTIHA